MSGTKISVVIPTYNRQSLLNRAIGSVLSQTLSSLTLEVIVVDDCSLIPADVSCFNDEGIKLIRMYENTGPQIARNIGIRQATGDWVIMLDDDDELVAGALEKALFNIKSVEYYTEYPVFFFATTNGRIPESFKLIGPVDIMNGNLYGDFTPVLNRLLFLQNNFQYINFPEIHGVGCEQLTWLHISSKILIPSFMVVLVKVNHDAPMRLTSYDNFIRNSYKFALQQDITIDFVKQNKLEELAPSFVEKKRLGAAIYYLVSGDKKLCRARLKAHGRRIHGINRLMGLLSYFPVFIPRFIFLKYKRLFSG
jgi:glycosyltransferase involved in cell wall biosynthesis